MILPFLIIPTAYGQSITGWYQGGGQPDSKEVSSVLHWNVDGQLQDTSGDTDAEKSFLATTGRLSFTDEQGTLGTIIGITVDGWTDVSGIGNNFCHSPVNWKFEETLTVNGVEYDIGKTISNSPEEHNPALLIFKDRGLRFEPSLVERLLANQGVILQNGDEIKWKVTASNDLTLALGQVVNTSTREPLSNLQFLRGDSGTCNVSDASLFLNDLTVEGEEIVLANPNFKFDISDDVIAQKGVIAYSIGKSVEFDIIYLDDDQALLDLSAGSTGDPDFDNDGIPDALDGCTLSPETVNNFEDEDGCPDTIPPPTITVTEGDVEVEIPVEVGEGEIVVIDQETGEAVVIANTDNDSDGIPNDLDDCPDKQGIPRLNGCPDTSGTVEQREFLQREFDRIEANKPVTNVHIDVNDDITTEKGVEGTCDNATQDCGDVITQAFRDLERFSGIKLPFEPSIINFMIIFGTIAGVIVIIAKVTKKI